ncbi:MAG: PspA/IM30 family protein [Chloroflexota bacterium]
MAQSILDKINTLISANLHSMVDSALQANSVKVMDEYVRQAERNLDDLEDATVTVGGSVKTLKRKYDEISSTAEKIDRNIDTLLTSGKSDLAAAAQTDLNQKQQLAQEYYEQWQQQQNEYQKMLDAKLKLESRLTTTKQEREHLKALMELAEAKSATTKTIRSLNDLAGVGDDDVRKMGDAIRARLDREDAQLEMSSTRLQDQMDDVLEKGEVDSQLEERRKRLGLSGSGGDGGTSSGTTSSSGATSS